MFKRYWIAAIALGIGFSAPLLSVVQTSAEQTKPNREYGQRQNSDGHEGSHTFSVPVRILKEPKETESAKRQKQEADQREIEDLAAQQRMADATDEMVWLTKLQFVLGAFGTGLIFYTLYLNWQSTSTALKTLQADRAWMMMVGTQGITVNSATVDGEHYGKAFIIRLQWRNDGRSPALNAIADVRRQFVDASDFVPTFRMGLPVAGAPVGPGNSVYSKMIILRRNQLLEIQRHEKYMFIFGAIEYSDIFDQSVRRRTEGCYLVEIEDRIGEDGSPQPSVGLLPRGEQNRAT